MIRIVAAYVVFLACAKSVACGHTDAEKPPLVVVSASEARELITYVVDDDRLVRRNSCKTSGRPASTCFRPDGCVLYCTLRDTEAIASFLVEPGGRLRRQCEVAVGFTGSYLTCSQDGRFLLASSYRDGLIAVFRLDALGAIDPKPLQKLETDANAHSVVFDRSGQFVFVSHTRPNSIFQYRFDATTGLLTPNDPLVLQRGDSTGPRHLVFGGENRFAYGSDEQGSSLSMYQFNEAEGVLTHRQTVSALGAEFEGRNTASHVEVHPRGNAAYVANRGDNSLAVFAIDSNTMDVRLVQRVAVDPVPRSFSITADGDYMIVAGQKSHRLQLFAIDSRGWLVERSSEETGKTPRWVSCSPATPTGKTSRSLP